jgi:hypothetical protein
LIRQPLSSEALEREIGALFIVDAKLGASVLAKIELGKIPVKMLAIYVLVDANKTAFEDRKEALKGIGMNIAALPFKFGVIDGFMAGDRRREAVSVTKRLSLWTLPRMTPMAQR